MYVPEGELLGESPDYTVEQAGKSVLLIYRDSTGKPHEQEGVQTLEYRLYQSFGKTRFEVLQYDGNGNLTEGFAKSVVTLKRKGKISEYAYYTKHGKLMMPEYSAYARSVVNYYPDGSWNTKYYDANNKPVCGNVAFETLAKWDSIQEINGSDTSYILIHKILSRKDCKGNVLE